MATAVAGTRQRENVITLFENWDDVSKYADIASNAYGTATEKMEAYTDSIEASKNRLTNAVEQWSLNLNQSETLKAFYNTLANVTENLDKVLLIIGGFIAVANAQKVTQLGASGLSVLGTRAMQFGNFFGGVKKDGFKGAFVNTARTLKEQTEQSFLVMQQKEYGNSLANATKLLQEEQKLAASQLQTNLLYLDSKEKGIASQLLLNSSDQNLLNSNLKQLTSSELLNLARVLLTEEELNQVTEIRDDTLTITNEDEARRLMINSIKNYSGRLDEATLKVIGNNVGNSAKANAAGALTAGAISIGGMFLGSAGGKGFGKLLGGDGIGGSMLGGIAGSMAGSVLGKAVPAMVATGTKAWGAGLTLSSSIKAGLSAGAATGPIGAAAAALGVLAVGAIVNGIKKARAKALKELQDAFKEDVEIYNNMKAQMVNASKFDELNNGVDSKGRNVSLSDEDYQKYLELSNQLAEVFPTLVVSTDEAGNKIVGMGDAVGDVTEAIKEMTEAAQEEADRAFVEEKNGQSAFKGNIDSARERIDQLNEEAEKREKESQAGFISSYHEGGKDTLYKIDSEYITSPLYEKIKQDMLNSDKWSDYAEEIKNNSFETIDNKALVYIRNELAKAYSPSIDRNLIKDVNYVNASMLDDYKAYIRALSKSRKEGSQEAEKLLTDMSEEENAIYESALKQIDVTGDVEDQINNTIKLLNTVFDTWGDTTLDLNGQEYTMSQLASMSYGSFDFVGNAEAAREALKNQLIEAFGDVSDWTEEQKQFAISIGFEIEDGSLKDTENTLLKLKETLGIEEGNSLPWGDVSGWSTTQLNSVYKLATGGYIDANTSVIGLMNLLASEPQTAKLASQRAQRLDQNYTKGGQDLAQYYMNLKNGNTAGLLNEEGELDKNYILENFGQYGSGMVESITNDAQAIVDVINESGKDSEEAVEQTANSIKNTLEQYDAMIVGAYKDTARKYSQEVFSGVETGANGYIDTAEEMVGAIDSITTSFEKLDQIQSDINSNGTASLKSVYELLSESERYIELFDFSGDNKTIKLVDNAESKMLEIQKEAMLAQIDAQKRENLLRIDELELQNKQIEAEGTYTDEALQSSIDVISGINAEGEAVAALANQYLSLGEAAAYSWALRRGDTLGAAAHKSKAIAGTNAVTFNKQETSELEQRSKITEEAAKLRYDQNKEEIEQLKKKNELLDKQYEITGYINSSEDWSKLYDSSAKLDEYKKEDKYLDKLKSKLSAINKEWYDMAKYKDWATREGQEDDYYIAIKNTLDAVIERLKQKLALEMASNGVTEEYYELLQQLQEYEVQRENLDDEEAEDKISIIESQGLINDKLISAYETLVETADTEAEYYEYQSRLNEKIKEQKELLFSTLQYQKDLLDTMLEYENATPATDRYNSLIAQSESNLRQQMLNAAERASTAYTNLYNAARGQGYSKEESKAQAEQNSDYQSAVKEYIEAFKSLGEVIVKAFEDKVEELQKRIDKIGDSKAKKWTSIEQIEKYYGNLDRLYNYILEQAQITLQNIDGLTDEEIQKIIDDANDAIKNVNENMIDMYDDIKNYQEDIYGALKNEIDRYKEQLQTQKDVIEDVYDKELEKLSDKQQSIERTNRLLEIQNNLENAREEKQKVFRSGIGWTYEQDRSKIKQAEKELKDFQTQDQIDDLNAAKDAELKVLDERISNWDEYLAQLEEKYGEYDKLQEQRLLRELLGIETQEELEQRIKEDMDSFVDYIDNNQASMLESMADTYLAFGSTFDDFLGSYKDNLETLDYYNTRTLDLLSAGEYTATNGAEVLQYLDDSKLTEEQKQVFRGGKGTSVITSPVIEEQAAVATGKIPYNASAKYYQEMVGTTADGQWGPKSAQAAADYLNTYYGGNYKASDFTDLNSFTSLVSSSSFRNATKNGSNFVYNGVVTSTGEKASGSGAAGAKTSSSNTIGSNLTNTSTSTIQSIVGVKADGIYGKDTTAAVKDWQAAHGLVADGIVGPKTAAAMGLSGYASGIEVGPVEYTGLAMLHGTPSKPEYVLNSDQAYNLLRYMATNKPEFTTTADSGNITYSYGDIIMNGVNDPETFFSELTNAMDRKYSTTKNRR